MVYKRILLGASVLMFTSVAFGQIKINTKSIGAATKAVQAVTLSNEDVINYTKEYIQWMDQNNPVAPDDHEFAVRLKKLTENLSNYDGLDLNFKVYLVRDVNAFACADGSVRVCAGLMQEMDDQEVLGVIGHEIGHVKNMDSRDAFKNALMTSALKDGVSSQGGGAGALSNSQLGELGEQVANMSFSRKQESAADDYGYKFLKDNGVNPWYMSMSFERLLELSGDTSEGGLTKKLFSSHPDTKKRVEEMAKKAEKDGFEKPSK
ncbi:M48 family metallopeptidase [Sphingobacterium chuzhouense]|uniref:M48 family metallopeptidase n=1 Tax=Sphingobacterium chuzhouense TaxID=1742264 RepID=A0ABR7XM03_9SPHI|nr:M48 family metallopeptidase [Sphingobacterium chuzhouense]MBD1420206.1 M48 family metallopeptidase [Sphingobacterium chuzhouense]